MGKGEAGQFQAWPALVAPLGLTLVLGLAAWLFAAKVDGEREEAAAAARKLESYARLEASEIASAASASAAEYVNAKMTARRAQEQNLRVEAKGVMDSLSRFLAASMDNARKKGAARREVGSFPSGFDGVRRFLEIMPQDDGRDRAKALLEAIAPELSGLLPAGFALTVVEDHAREMLAVGGTAGGEGVVSASVSRDMIFDDGLSERHWTLRLEVTSPDQNPPPTAKEVAEHLDRRLGGVRPENVAWRGWLLGDGSAVAASFPTDPPAAGVSPPFIDAPGVWKILDGGSLVWLERPRERSDLEWNVGVSVLIAAPAEEPTMFGALQADVSWAATLLGIGIACLGSWGWFVRAALSEPHSERDAATEERKTAAAPREAEKPQRRLVRDPEAARGIAETEGVIVADIDAGGKVRLSTPPAAMPSGSLTRLQAIHRGKKGAIGSRILDHAKSALLREMAERVRPQPQPLHQEGVARESGVRSPAPVREKLPPPRPSLKQGTVTGWNKVAE